MRTVGIKVLKDKLSQYVRLARDGETVLISDRDRVVAELGPPRSDRPSRIEDAAVAALVSEGILEPATHAGTGVPTSLRVASTAELLAELARDREDR